MGLEELFQTVEKETTEPISTTVTGTIPEWLEGSLYRNGPAKFEFGDTKYNYWFDGMAMLHRFKISKGSVTYQDRFIETEHYRKNVEANRIVCSELGTVAYPDPCKTCFERVFSYFKLPVATDNTVVNVFPIGEWLYAATETNLITRIDPDTLKSKGQVDLEKVVCVNGATAHPHQDTDGCGAVYNIGYIYSGTPKYAIIKITPPTHEGDDKFCEKAEIMAEIPAQWRMHPSYIHSFALTPNYIVIIEQPMCISTFKILTAQLRGKPSVDAMEFYPEYPTKFHIVDRRTSKKVNPDTNYVADTFVTFHHINAYEENGEIVVDTCVLSYSAYQKFSLDKLQRPGCEDHVNSFPESHITRFVLPVELENAELGKNLVTVENTTSTAVMTALRKKKDGIAREVHVTADRLTDFEIEFPQINYTQYNGRKHRYVYGIGRIFKTIAKLDVQTWEMKVWSEQNVFCSEPVFVAAPDAKEEDDGVLLSLILTTGVDRSAYLLVLDAASMQEIGRAEAPVKIGVDLHGTFINTK